jgi:hypothetical protein
MKSRMLESLIDWEKFTDSASDVNCDSTLARLSDHRPEMNNNPIR